MIPISSFTEEDYGDEFTVSIKDNTTIIDYPEECYGDGAEIIYRLDSSSDKWVKIQGFECPEPETSEQAADDHHCNDCDEDHEEHGYDHSDEDVGAMYPPLAAADEDLSKSGSSIFKINIIVSTCMMIVYLITK